MIVGKITNKVYGVPRLRLALTNLNLYHGIQPNSSFNAINWCLLVMNRRLNKPTTTIDYNQCPNSIRHLPEANAWNMDINYLKLSNVQLIYLAFFFRVRNP